MFLVAATLHHFTTRLIDLFQNGVTLSIIIGHIKLFLQTITVVIDFRHRSTNVKIQCNNLFFVFLRKNNSNKISVIPLVKIFLCKINHWKIDCK